VVRRRGGLWAPNAEYALPGGAGCKNRQTYASGPLRPSPSLTLHINHGRSDATSEMVSLPPKGRAPQVARLVAAITVGVFTEFIIGDREQISPRTAIFLATAPVATVATSQAISKRSRRKDEDRKALLAPQRLPTQTPASSPTVERVTGRQVLRWLSWQIPGRTGIETVFQTRGAASESEIAKDQTIMDALAPSKHLTMLPARYVIAAHASRWGTGKPLCGSEAGRLNRVRMPWGQEMDTRGRLRRCLECLQLAPLDGTAAPAGETA
jgi:hypothetical protein